MHKKVNDLPSDCEELDDKVLQDTRYEKSFVTGRVGNDYKHLLEQTTKVRKSESLASADNKRFKVIVEGGQLFL